MNNYNDVNREAAKISALLSGKIDKYEYLTGKEILPSDERKVIEQANLNILHQENILEKQAKTIEKQGKKQIKPIEDHGKNSLNLVHLLKRILISTEIAYHLKNEKKYLMNLLKKCLLNLEFRKNN